MPQKPKPDQAQGQSSPISRTSAAVSSNQTVLTVTASGFGTSVPSVVVGATSVVVINASPSFVVAQLPPVSPGTYLLTVTCMDNPITSATSAVTIGAGAQAVDGLSNTRALVYQNRFLKEIDLETGNIVQSWEIPFPFTQRSIAHVGQISYIVGQFAKVYVLDRSSGTGSTLDLVRFLADYDNTVVAASPNERP